MSLSVIFSAACLLSAQIFEKYSNLNDFDRDEKNKGSKCGALR